MWNFAFFIIGFLFLSFPLRAQKNIDSLPQLQTQYQEYFALNRQQAFVQLNKTTFLPDETLWFAAYLYTFNKNLPSFNTTNLQVSLFNSEGKQLKTSTVYIENGKGYGNFDLSTRNFPPGNYVLKASTTYMKNFQEKSPFIQVFHIIGKQQKQADTTSTHYDLQLLPEGGHLLANATNNIGVKLIDDRGHGVLFTQGELKTTDGKLLRIFKSNRFGISKFTFRPEPGKSYRVSLRTLDGKTISQTLKKPENRGLNLVVTNLPKKVLFTLNTNQASIADISSQTFYLCGHQSGAMKTIEFRFPENRTSAQIQIDKDALYSGLNTITIFNQEFQPLLERLVFNRDGLILN